MIRFVFLILHTPTEDGEVAQECFSEGTLVTDLRTTEDPCPRAELLELTRYKQAKPNSQNLLNIATRVGSVNRVRGTQSLIRCWIRQSGAWIRDEARERQP